MGTCRELLARTLKPHFPDLILWPVWSGLKAPPPEESQHASERNATVRCVVYFGPNVCTVRLSLVVALTARMRHEALTTRLQLLVCVVRA